MRKTSTRRGVTAETSMLWHERVGAIPALKKSKTLWLQWLFIFISRFQRKLVASYLEEEDVVCWKETFVPVVKSGREANIRNP